MSSTSPRFLSETAARARFSGEDEAVVDRGLGRQQTSALGGDGTHGTGMTQLSVNRTRILAPPSRALRYLPVSALLLDLVVITCVMVLAAWGRTRLGVFDSASDVTSAVLVAGPLI